MQRPIVLLVDDEADLVEVLCDAIEVRLPGYEVRRAASVTEARAALAAIDRAQGQLALVVSDHHLGDGNGLHLLAELRVARPDLAAILYTGQADPQIVADAQRAQLRLLWKPIRLATWISEVRAALLLP